LNTPQKTGEQFYPLHYASCHGNQKLIDLLINNGANPFVKSVNGLNMLHVAAQGD
jgi:ankyrin repeat protein